MGAGGTGISPCPIQSLLKAVGLRLVAFRVQPSSPNTKASKPSEAVHHVIHHNPNLATELEHEKLVHTLDTRRGQPGAKTARHADLIPALQAGGDQANAEIGRGVRDGTEGRQIPVGCQDVLAVHDPAGHIESRLVVDHDLDAAVGGCVGIRTLIEASSLRLPSRLQPAYEGG